MSGIMPETSDDRRLHLEQRFPSQFEVDVPPSNHRTVFSRAGEIGDQDRDSGACPIRDDLHAYVYVQVEICQRDCERAAVVFPKGAMHMGDSSRSFGVWMSGWSRPSRRSVCGRGWRCREDAGKAEEVRTGQKNAGVQQEFLHLVELNGVTFAPLDRFWRHQES